MSEGAGTGGSAWKRFSGHGNTAASDYKVWKRWMKAKIAVETRRGLPREAVGPMVFTLLDGEAEKAVEHLEVNDLEREDGEESIFVALDERFPDREASDRIGDSLESVFGLVIEKGETTQAYTGRARTLFASARKEGVDLPPVARGFLLLRGARLGPERRAIVLAASQKQWGFEEIASALRTTYPKQMPSAHIHAVSADGNSVYPDGVPAPVAAATSQEDPDDVTEAEINALVEDDSPIEEEDAIDILATWKETRSAMSKERLQRGFRSTRDALNKLEMKNRCFLCKKVGHFSKVCPLRRKGQSTTSSASSAGTRPHHSVGMVSVEVLMANPDDDEVTETVDINDEDDTWSEIEVLLSSWSRDGDVACKVIEGNATLISKLSNQERFRRLARERREVPHPDFDEDASAPHRDDDDTADCDECEICLCHSPGCGAVDTGCGMCLIGSNTLKEHIEVTKIEPEWIPDAATVRFKAYDGKSRTSNRACWLRWQLPKVQKTIKLMVYVVEGDAGLLISKPVLKMLKARIDTDTDSLYLGAVDVRVPLGEAKGTGHYEVDFQGVREASSPRPLPIDSTKLIIEDGLPAPPQPFQ
jgi:hypothetical protein